MSARSFVSLRVPSHTTHSERTSVRLSSKGTHCSVKPIGARSSVFFKGPELVAHKESRLAAADPVRGARFGEPISCSATAPSAEDRTSDERPAPVLNGKVTPSSPTGKRVVVTGSTKGLGLALVDSFLKGGDCVCVCSRTEESVATAVAQLQETYGVERVCGAVCNVSNGESVQALCDLAVESMGSVDVWINNAGSNAYAFQPLTEFSAEMLEEVVLTNSLGALICCRAAIELMSKQPNGGHIFLMEGAGSDGSATRKYAAYGYTKAGMTQLAKSLSVEVKDLPIGVHTMSPGMVATDLLSCGQYAFGAQGRFFVNALAEPPKVVSEALVPMIREVAAEPAAGSNANKALRVFISPLGFLKNVVKGLVVGTSKHQQAVGELEGQLEGRVSKHQQAIGELEGQLEGRVSKHQQAVEELVTGPQPVPVPIPTDGKGRYLRKPRA